MGRRGCGSTSSILPLVVEPQDTIGHFVMEMISAKVKPVLDRVRKKKKLLIGLSTLIGISLLIVIIAIVAPPAEQPGQVEPAPAPEAPAPEKTELTTAEQSYAVNIAEQVLAVGQALGVLGQLMQSPEYGTEAWVLQTASRVAIIWTACNKTMELEPPDSMAHIHLKYVQGMKHFDTMTELLAHGIDEADPDLLNEAIVEMKIGAQLIDEANELMKEFTEERS